MTETSNSSQPATSSTNDLLEKCGGLERKPSILDALGEELQRCGVAGDLRPYQLTYLCSFTRLFDHPASIVIKGPSGAGKSHAMGTALRFIPTKAYFPISGMSEKAIIRIGKEELKHKHLVITEFAGLQNEGGNRWLRTLLSEGRLSYLVSSKKDGDWDKSKTVGLDGPTGVIMTTTDHALHAEDETRMLSLPISSDAKLTREILRAKARGATMQTQEPNVATWHALHDLVAVEGATVVIPFAEALSETFDASSERRRRDFDQVLVLIKAHAVLHSASRQRAGNAIVATMEDYKAVHALVADLLAESTADSLSPETAEMVYAIASIEGSRPHAFPDGIPQFVLVEKMGLDKSVISRRVKSAIAQEYVVNEEPRSGTPAKLRVFRSPKTAEVREALPNPEALQAAIGETKPSMQASLMI